MRPSGTYRSQTRCPARGNRATRQAWRGGVAEEQSNEPGDHRPCECLRERSGSASHPRQTWGRGRSSRQGRRGGGSDGRQAEEWSQHAPGVAKPRRVVWWRNGVALPGSATGAARPPGRLMTEGLAHMGGGCAKN